MNPSTQVATNSRKKPRLVLGHNITDDIITNLHESVLTHILSRLPTKDAFRTCILSKHWEWKWTSSYNLDIDDCWWQYPSTRRFSKKSFVNFMDTILISPQHRLRSFHLKCTIFQDLGRLQTWISAVQRRGVERFDLTISKRGSILPYSLMNTTSLRTFELRQFEYNLDIDDCWLHQLRTRTFREESFVKFMDTILISPQHRLRSFRLKCQHYKDSGRLQTWISSALRRGVERFDLNVDWTYSSVVRREDGSFELNVDWKGRVSFFPCSLMNTTSLRTFKFHQLNGILNVLTKNFLPNLTSLYLGGVHIVNGNANAMIVTFTFPVLETLTLFQCKWLNVESVEIYAPSLTTFISQPMNMGKEYDYSIMIVAPGLTTFECSYGLPEKFILNGSSIVSALLHSEGDDSESIQLLAIIGLRVRKLLNTCTSLEELELSELMANVLQSGPPLRCLDKLKRLTLRGPSNAGQLFELLHAAPSLKYLYINLWEWDDSYRGAMESMPSCIVSQLEEVVIRGFYHLLPECTTAQYDVLKYFLKNAEQLKKFRILGYVAPLHKPEELREILSTFPKCSPYLTIEVVVQQRKSSIP